MLWNVSQIAMSPLSAMTLWRQRQRHTRRARGLVKGVFVQPFVSIVVTAFNEELTIVDSIHALLALDYRPRELVIVNDGSTDGTLALLEQTFQLVHAPLAFIQPLKSEAGARASTARSASPISWSSTKRMADARRTPPTPASMRRQALWC